MRANEVILCLANDAFGTARIGLSSPFFTRI
jgi:hypothetical protein